MLKVQEDARAPACKVSLHHTDFIFFSYLVIQCSWAQVKQLALVYLAFTSQEVKAASTRTHLHLHSSLHRAAAVPWWLQPPALSPGRTPPRRSLPSHGLRTEWAQAAQSVNPTWAHPPCPLSSRTERSIPGCLDGLYNVSANNPKARCLLGDDKRTAESRHGDCISLARLTDYSEIQPNQPDFPKMIINSTSSWKQGVHYASEEHYKNSAQLGYFDYFITCQIPTSKTGRGRKSYSDPLKWNARIQRKWWQQILRT